MRVLRNLDRRKKLLDNDVQWDLIFRAFAGLEAFITDLFLRHRSIKNEQSLPACCRFSIQNVPFLNSKELKWILKQESWLC